MTDKNPSLGSIDLSGETLHLSGQLDYRNGKALKEKGKQLIQSSSASCLMLDCSNVTRTTSVGLALILSLIRDSKTAGKELTIKSLTEDLSEIANFSNVFDLLPLDKSFTIINKVQQG